MDDLNDLALFAAVVKHGNFSQAARSMNVTKSLISRRIAVLESHLGVRLLQRSTRAVTPTEIGQRVYLHADLMNETSRAAFDAARQASQKAAGRLRISCPPGVGNFFLAPLLPRFRQRYPDVRIEFDMTNRQVDVISEGCDVAFRVRTRVEDSSLVIRDFGASEQVLVASPEFVAQHGPFDCLASLMEVRAAGGVKSGLHKPRWRLIAPDSSHVAVTYHPQFETDDVLLLAQSALSGMAVSQVPFHVCESLLDDGRFSLVLAKYRVHAPHLFAVMPSRRLIAPATRAFIDFLSDALVMETQRASRKLQALREAQPHPPA